MVRKGSTVRYTADELQAMIDRGEFLTDWDRVRAMSQEEVERLAAEDEGDLPQDWGKFRRVYPGFQIDPDLIHWFRAQGGDYQKRINCVLRDYMEATRRKAG